MTNLNSKIEISAKLYKDALENALRIEEDLSWIRIYKERLKILEDIVECLKTNDESRLKKIFDGEGHLYGWLFPTDAHGLEVNNTFWRLNYLVYPEK